MDFFSSFAENLVLSLHPNPNSNNFKRQKIQLKDLETFLRHLELVIPYYLRTGKELYQEEILKLTVAAGKQYGVFRQYGVKCSGHYILSPSD